MLSSVRERLATALVALLPLHAFAVTVATRIVAGPGRAPLGALALWKEAMLALVLTLAIIEICAARKKTAFRSDLLDGLIAALILLSVIVTVAVGGGMRMLLLGIRYDLVPLAALLVFRRVRWSDRFWRETSLALVAAGCALAAYGLLTLVLPDAFFAALGYSPLHSLYVPDGPIAAFQYIGGAGVRRIQSTMSGPNQFGLWLLLPWAIAVSGKRLAISTDGSFSTRYPLPAIRFLHSCERLRYCIIFLIGIAIIGTLSRAAWIAAAVIALVALWRVPGKGRRLAAGSLLVGAGLVLGLALVRPGIVLRAASSADHVRRPIEAVQRILARPLGSGLASAGPASNRVSDACVDLPAGADASWARPHAELCVFVGGAKVQPLDRACSCPFLPENWYLQIGVETGVLGFALFIVLILIMLHRLKYRTRDAGQGAGHEAEWIFLAFLGVSVGALVLHAWEDAAVAYALWMLAAGVLPVSAAVRHSRT